MEIQEINQRLYDSFNMDKVDQELNRRDQLKASQPIAPEPVDIYQRDQERIYDVSKKSFPKGSSAITNMAVASVIDGAGGEGLAHAFKEAKEDINALKERGERGRAELIRKQYMQESFLPAVELVVNSTSPDETLNSKKALDELDKYVLLEGSGKGYTASYIRQAYGNQLGNVEGRSDASVRSGVRKLNALLDAGEIRTAVGIANKLKDKIDKGMAQADDIDYELIGRVVSYYK